MEIKIIWMKKEIIFITGNEDKFREFREILVSVKLIRKNITLPELQGTPEEIVKEKAKIAAKIMAITKIQRKI